MASSGNDGTNPFDFDVDFDKVQRRREQYLARKAAERGETLLSGMDAEDNKAAVVDDDPNSQTINQAANARLGKMTLGFKNFMNNARAAQGGVGGAVGATAGLLSDVPAQPLEPDTVQSTYVALGGVSFQ